MTDPTPRDRALAGEVVKLTDERLAEMKDNQAMFIEMFDRNRDVESLEWLAVVNELIATRKEIERLTRENANHIVELAWRDREIDSLRVQMGAQIAPLKVPMEAPPKYQSIPTPPGRPNGSLPAMSLSKRELIAAMAMQGLCAAITGYNGPSRLLNVEGMAQDAIGAADALLKELAR